jgi:hypothetical protein
LTAKERIELKVKTNKKNINRFIFFAYFSGYGFIAGFGLTHISSSGLCSCQNLSKVRAQFGPI